MRCRYQCVDCGEWHDAFDGDVNIGVLWFMFMLDPPPPFTRREWDVILKAEMLRRSR